MEDHAPLISIIVPVYNYKAYLRRCLDSIAAQTFSDWECLVVDDGSSDGSAAICDEYATNDPRFRVIHKENGGVSSARNAGLEAARGEFLMFSDQDDAIDPHSMEYALEMQRQDPEAMVMWKFTRDETEFREKCQEPLSFRRLRYLDMFWQDNLFHTIWNRMYSMDTVRRSGIRFDVTLGWKNKLGEDVDFNQKYIHARYPQGDFTLLCSEQPRYFYFPDNSAAVTENLEKLSVQALPQPQSGYLEPLLTECARILDTVHVQDQVRQAYSLCHHYLRCFAFGLWSARQLKEPLPEGFFRRPEIRRLLDLTKTQKVFSVYYLPFRLHMARLSARLYAWDESHHINYWRCYELMYRLFFRGWKK